MLTGHHEVVTEERLNHLAGRFRAGQIKRFAGVTFEQYILAPDIFDRMAAGPRRRAGTIKRSDYITQPFRLRTQGQEG